MLVFNYQKRQLEKFNWKKAGEIQKMTEDKLKGSEYEAEVLTMLDLPDEFDLKLYDKPGSFWRWWSTYDDVENMRILILLSTKNFSWVYQLKKPTSESE